MPKYRKYCKSVCIRSATSINRVNQYPKILNSLLRFDMKCNILTGLVAAVRDSISACVIQILLVDCNDSKQMQHQSSSWLCEHVIYVLMFRVISCFCTEPYRASARRCRRTSEGDHFLDGQAEFEPVQRVADADLPLDLRVRQVSHDGAALHVGTTGCHIPCWHPDPQLDEQREDVNGNTWNDETKSNV